MIAKREKKKTVDISQVEFTNVHTVCGGIEATVVTPLNFVRSPNVIATAFSESGFLGRPLLFAPNSVRKLSLSFVSTASISLVRSELWSGAGAREGD